MKNCTLQRLFKLDLKYRVLILHAGDVKQLALGPVVLLQSVIFSSLGFAKCKDYRNFIIIT